MFALHQEYIKSLRDKQPGELEAHADAEFKFEQAKIIFQKHGIELIAFIIVILFIVTTCTKKIKKEKTRHPFIRYFFPRRRCH